MKKLIQFLGISLLLVAVVLARPTISFAQGKGQEKEKGPKKEMGDQGKAKPGAMPQEEKGHEGHDHGKSNQGNSGKDKKAEKEDQEDKDAKPEKADDGNQGNAYGKNKGEMSGREFGQNRAAEARSKNEAKKAEVKKSVDEGDQKVAESRQRIKKAREKLEKDKKAKRVNQKQYEDRKKKIEEAERQTDELESKIKMVKPQMDSGQ